MTDEDTATWKSADLANLLLRVEDRETPEDKTTVDEMTNDLLEKHLAGPVLFWDDGGDPATLMDQIRRDMTSEQGKPLGRVLCGGGLNVHGLNRIKEYWKDIAAREEHIPANRPEYASALAVYYFAIASALVHHSERILHNPTEITGHSLAELSKAFGKLTRRSWVPQELKDLCAQAKTLCDTSEEGP